MGAAQRPPSKTDELTIKIRDAIRRGELARGALYSAEELGRRFGVSRTPVRESLLRLADANLVRIERNRGVWIVGSTPDDVQEIFTLRLLLEPPATRRAATLMTPADVAALMETLDQMRRHRDDPDEFFAADRRFHDLILRAAKNSRLSNYVASLRDIISLQGTRTVPAARTADQIVVEHTAVAEALAAGDGGAAADRMRSHLLSTAALLLGEDNDLLAGLDWPV
ncbi:GntR family transcriptional regulator [Nonomuraea sp. NPDC046802]|uniref:GntR family transcriptional regulator n=1 Tax=Nonomuraea sp. NPDC046802 TaxID=3154919 RepID=UPI0033C94034